MTEVRFIDLSGVIKADARGQVFFPWPGPLEAPGDLLATLHLVSIRPGQTRGHHLHPGHAETLYPFHGDALLIWEAPPGRLRERLLTGDRTLVHIPPGIPHAVTNPGPEILYLLAWREATGDGRAAPDTVPHPLGI
ncbi:MAG: cupin domain-containing protein [Syntrophobacterales bacterium]|jgi:oxalate decarboxylase/phosphoglucose isomerase-like protein (cupin superfamily)|nr:cupin domain-containing protein [Syntrophobacterales bacterium]